MAGDAAGSTERCDPGSRRPRRPCLGDGFVALLPIYLLELGFSALAIAAIVCDTLIGTALLTV